VRYTIHFSEEAEYDLFDACEWYDNQKVGLARQLELAVEDCLITIAENPKKFQLRHKNIHIAFLDRFPYGIHFFEEGNKINVIGIFHMSRSPKNWNLRS
jgi:toxin ParE1/3/4